MRMNRLVTSDELIRHAEAYKKVSEYLKEAASILMSLDSEQETINPENSKNTEEVKDESNVD